MPVYKTRPAPMKPNPVFSHIYTKLPHISGLLLLLLVPLCYATKNRKLFECMNKQKAHETKDNSLTFFV